MEYWIIPMPPDSWLAVRDIYAEGIATGNATFETEVPEWEEWDRRHLKSCRVVAMATRDVAAEDNDEEEASFFDEQIATTSVGWAALSPVSDRAVYRGVAEVSVYVATSAQRQGAGKALLTALIDQSERAGIWTLQAGIFPENAASLALHKSCGFVEVGVRRRIGKLGDAWKNVILLERRSTTVGA